MSRVAIGGEKEYAKIVDSDAMENAKLFVCSNATGELHWIFQRAILKTRFRSELD